ncbi:hypothetical protein ACS0TY_026397 [Phlomoides rotata]
MAQNARAPMFSLHLHITTSPTNLTFHIFCIFPIRISQHLTATFCTLTCSILHFTRLQFLSSRLNHTISIIALLIAFLQLKYQGNDKTTPFSTHPAAMLVAVSCTTAYYVAYITLLMFPTFASISHQCLIVSCNVLVASLASVVFPDSVRPFVWAVFVLISATGLLYHKLVEVAEFLIRKMRIVPRLLNMNRRRERLPISSTHLHTYYL